MKDQDYLVKRDDIWVGSLVKPKHIFKNSKLYAHESEFLRPILYVHTDDNMVDDLLYDSPNYPILNCSCDFKCYKSIYVIDNPQCISEYLKKHGYLSLLDYEEVLELSLQLTNKELNQLDVFSFNPAKEETVRVLKR